MISRPVRWAGTFARGGRRTKCNALMRRYVTMAGTSPIKSALTMGDLAPLRKQWFLGPT